MKRTRIGRLSRQWLATTPLRSATTAPRISRLSSPAPIALHGQIRCQATAITPDAIFDESTDSKKSLRRFKPSEVTTSPGLPPQLPKKLPSPLPERALRSAKLAALHARLSLSSKIPIQTLARALVDPSADGHPRFNNANMAFIGASVLQYHTSEWLVTRYPRLPMGIIFSAMKGYAGEPALHRIARSWGVEAVGAPGEEVDPGYLQFSKDKPTVMHHKWGYARAEAKELRKYKWRRGMSSRIVLDNPFGNTVSESEPEPKPEPAQIAGVEPSNARNKREVLMENPEENAHANFVRAVVGAIYVHCGTEAAKTFAKSHVLSRRLDLANLFSFKNPQLELTRLCAREDFDPPIARLLSETGRLSRTPVFVVGIYSGRDKLGEAAGPNLSIAKISAAVNALKSWYLYSPGRIGVPSDMFADDAKPWIPVYVDIGEIVS